MGKSIVCNNISKLFLQGTEPIYALRNLSLSVQKGEFVALCGPSGSGKTTLLNLMGGLDQPTNGEIIIGGTNLKTLSKSKLADFRLHSIGFIFQAFNLIPILSARENVEFILELQGVAYSERKERAFGVLKAVGLETLSERRPHQLSGGQQQRVAVARAIVSEPELVLADEPTANLDSTSAKSLIDLMHKMNCDRAMTFIFSTHDPLVMEYARRLVRLQDGCIVSDASKEQSR